MKVSLSEVSRSTPSDVVLHRRAYDHPRRQIALLPLHHEKLAGSAGSGIHRAVGSGPLGPLHWIRNSGFAPTVPSVGNSVRAAGHWLDWNYYYRIFGSSVLVAANSSNSRNYLLS